MREVLSIVCQEWSLHEIAADAMLSVANIAEA